MKIKDRNPLVQLQAVKQYSKADQAANKLYPSLEIVRLEKIFFQSKKGKLLDYAIGGGCNAIHLLKRGYNVYGIDVTLNSLKLVRKIIRRNKKIKKPKLFLLKKNADRLPFNDNTFDYIIAMSVISLLGSEKKIKFLLSEFKRILKPQGKIIIDINDHNSEFSQNRKQIEKNVFLPKIIGNQVRCYCVKNKNDFAKIVKPFFKIVDLGFSSHCIFKREITEFIICAQNNKKNFS